MDAGSMSKEHEYSDCNSECANLGIYAYCLSSSEQTLREVDKLLLICDAEKPDKHVIRVDLPGKKNA
jgi:hypothetical protein